MIRNKQKKYVVSVARLPAGGAICMLFVWLVIVAALAQGDQPAIERVKIGHSAPITAFAFSPDGTRLMTANTECVIAWDATTGRKLSQRPWSKTWPRYSLTPQLQFHFLPDANLAIVLGDVWDLRSGKFLRCLLPGNELPLQCVASPDGRRTLLLLGGGAVELRDTGSGARLAALLPEDVQRQLKTDAANDRARDHRPMQIAFAPQGPLAVVGGGDKSGSIWDVQQGQLLRKFQTEMESCSTSPDGSYLVTRYWPDTGSSVEEAKIWDLRTGREITTLWEPMDEKDSIKFLPDGQHVVVGIERKKAELWHLGTGQKVREFAGHEQNIYAIDVSSDGCTMVTRSCDMAVRWDLFSGQRLATYRHPFTADLAKQERQGWPPARDRGLLVLPLANGTMLTSIRNRLLQVDPATAETIQKYDLALTDDVLGTVVGDIVLSPRGDRMLVLYRGQYHRPQHAALLRETATGKVLAEIAKSPLPESCTQLSPDGRYALTTALQEPTRLWELSTGRLLQMVGYAGELHNHRGPQVTFSPNGKYVVAHSSGAVLFWETATGRPVHQTPRPESPANRHGLYLAKAQQYQFRGRDTSDASGGWRACSYSDGAGDDPLRPPREEVVLWDVDRARRAHVFHRPDCQPSVLQLSADGRYLAIAWYRDQNAPMPIEFYELPTGKRILTVSLERANPSRAASIQFLPGKPEVLIHASGRSIEYWSLAAARQIRVLTDTTPEKLPFNPAGLRPDVMLSPGAQTVLADYSSRYAILWDLQSGQPLQTFEGDRGSCSLDTHFCFGPGGGSLLSRVERDQPPALWDLTTGCQRVEHPDFPNEHFAVRQDPSGYWCSAINGKTALLDPCTGKKVFSFPGPRIVSQTDYYCVSPDRRLVIAARERDAGLQLWDLRMGTPLKQLPATVLPAGQSGLIHLSDVDWTAQRAILCSERRTPDLQQTLAFAVHVWDLQSGQLTVSNLQHPDNSKKILAVLPVADEGLLTASADGTAILWDLHTGKQRQTYQGLPWNARSVALTQDQQRFVVHCQDGSFVLWDLHSGQRLEHCFLLHNASRWVTITPEGQAVGNLEFLW